MTRRGRYTGPKRKPYVSPIRHAVGKTLMGNPVKFRRAEQRTRMATAPYRSRGRYIPAGENRNIRGVKND